MVFIFNPETDYALAAGARQYTPPKSVADFRLRLTPSIVTALPHDEALLLFSSEERDYVRQVLMGSGVSRHATLVIPEELSAVIEDSGAGDEYIMPWGWNFSLRNYLSRIGVSDGILPSEDRLEDMRRLAHRRTTIPFNAEMNRLLTIDTPLPLEFEDADEAIRYVEAHPDSFMKSPWSCSGRGVAHLRGLTARDMEGRIRAAVRRQGSVMVESAASKVLDFASEWYLSGGKACFLGMSVFQAAISGEYGGNLMESQDRLMEIIKEASPFWTFDYIEAQKETLERLVAPSYTGPAGIDMLADKEGRIRTCVEVNLRHTMGHVALARTGVRSLGSRM